MNKPSIELLYIWIDKTQYHCFEHSEFNLSSNYSFEYDYQNHVLKCVKANYPNVFDKDKTLKNITAIVGNNGVGKTTFLNCIINRSFIFDFGKKKDNDNRSKFFIAAFEKEGKIVVENYTMDNIVFEFDGDSHPVPSLLIAKRYPSVFGSVTTAYLSTESKTKTEIGIEKSGSGTIIVTPYQFKNGGLSFLKTKSLDIDSYRIEASHFDLEDFVTTAYYVANDNKLVRNKNVTISFKTFSDVYVVKNASFSPITNIKMETLLSKKSLDESRLFLFGPVISLIFSLLDEISCLGFKTGDICKKEKIELNDLEAILLFVQENIRNEKTRKYFINAISEIKLLNEILGIDYSIDESVTLNEFLSRKELHISRPANTFKPLFNFVLKHDKSFILKYLVLEMDKSDGELSHLRHLSYLYYLANIERFAPKYKLNYNILLLLDEIENHLHPEWQRLLINDIVRAINNLFKDKNVYVVLTTHSPLVLSDIPSQNIIYISLDKDDNRVITKRMDVKTFGNNIFNLYNDSFYFNGGVLIGEYAKNYINNLYKEVTKLDACRNQNLKNEIMMIGEPVLRNKLLQLLNQESSDVKSEIKDSYKSNVLIELEKRMSEIQSLIDSLKAKDDND